MRYRIAGVHNYGERQVETYSIEKPHEEASLAFIFLEKWGMVSGAPDGEDSTGRQQSRLLTPHEVVKRGFDIAALAMKEARDRGLMLEVPDLDEVNREEKEAKQVEDEVREEVWK